MFSDVSDYPIVSVYSMASASLSKSSMTLKIEALLTFEMSKLPSLRGAHPLNNHQDTPIPSAVVCSL
jgi:hypothetical protein